jgi:toxin ParE1/3/4
MPRLRLSAPARDDIERILAHSEASFGPAARLRYEALLEAGLKDLAADPERPGVMRREELGPGVRIYHLHHSRAHARADQGTVGRPRHLLLFRLAAPDMVEIGRVLHDAMDMPEHVPEEYQSPDRRK